MLTSGLFAGCAAGLFAALLHFAFVQSLLVTAERYEAGEIVHFDTAPQPAAARQEGVSHAHDKDHAHTHATSAVAEGGVDLKRHGLTVVFAALIYCSYGLILAAGFALAGLFGQKIDLRDGVLWGLAGFMTFQLAPALGLAPELPGTVAAELSMRQAWWVGTILATGAGLALLAYGRGITAIAVACVLLAAPHVLGAPVPDGYHGVAPSELGAEFAARVLGVGLLAWVALGWLCARFWNQEFA